MAIMFVKARLPLFLFLLISSLFLASITSSSAFTYEEDGIEEYLNPSGTSIRREREEQAEGRGRGRQREEEEQLREYCQRRCQTQERSQQIQQQCQRACQQQVEEEQRQRRHREEQEERQQRDRRRGRGGEQSDHNRDDPSRQRYEDCKRRCDDREQIQERRRECRQDCEQRRREEEQRGSRDYPHGEESYYNPQREREREWEQQRESRNNPYHFRSQRLQSRYRTDEGHFRVLEKLSDRSELLRGLENYRLAVLEAEPNTFVVPHHCDADSVLVVTQGRGTIGIVNQNNKESHNIERSDVVITPAGSTVYLVNQESNERLQIMKLINPVNVPGRFEEYFPAGGENPESYFRAFSSNILQSSLSATREQIDRLIGEQRQGQRRGERQGFIKRASQEQLKALSQHATSPRRRGRESSGPINLENQSPIYSNDYGKFHEVNPDEHKQLKKMDVLVNWSELKQGAIMVPHYNSKATILAMVVEGSGRMEMACPHLSRQSQQREQYGAEQSTSSEEYQKVTARLSPGDVFIIPAGNPIAVVATSNQNLRMVGFGVNALNNERNFIAGKNNIIKQLEREAKELAFNMTGREVEQIFNQQPKLSYFVPQESQQEEEGRHKSSHPLASILNVAGFA